MFHNWHIIQWRAYSHTFCLIWLSTTTTRNSRSRIPTTLQGKSYPPKFVEGDTVKIELNKDTREVKMWVNDKAPFTVGGIDPSAKFFANMEGVQSAIEIVRIN